MKSKFQSRFDKDRDNMERFFGLWFVFVVLFQVSIFVGIGTVIYYLLTSPNVQRLLGY